MVGIVLTGDQRPYIGALVTVDRPPSPGGSSGRASRPARPSATFAATRTCGRPSRTPSTARTPRCPGPNASSGSASWPSPMPSGPSWPTQKVRRDYVLATYASDVQAL